MSSRQSLLAAIAAGAAAVFIASAAYAQAPAHKPAPPVVDPAAAHQADVAFAAWDSDKNGMLSLNEFRAGWAAVRRLSEVQARLQEQFRTVDTNRNNAIDTSEYTNLLLVKRAGKSAPPLSAFDSNKSQRLEFPEYVSLVRRLGATQPAALVVPK